MCTYICMCVLSTHNACVYVCVHTCVHVYKCVNARIFGLIYRWHVCIVMHIYMYVYACIYAYVYPCAKGSSDFSNS